MKKYYLHNGSEQDGPFDTEELKNKKLNKNTPIWYEGLNEWTTIEKVEELKDIVVSIPPPFSTNLESNSIEKEYESKSKSKLSSSSKQSNSWQRSLIIIITIVVIFYLCSYLYDQYQVRQYQNELQHEINEEEDKKSRIRNKITSYVTAERSEYNYSELGGISNLKISVSNNTDYLIDNVSVNLIYIKANGEVWNSRILDFNLIEPNTKSTIKVPDTERGTSVKYEIVSIKSASLGLK